MLKRPQQARSRQTLERFVDAAVALLEEQLWVDVTISALARRARSSVGAFYARFADKAGLLDYLDQRYAEEMRALLEHSIEQARAQQWSLEARAGHLIADLVGYHRRYRGLLRTLVLTARAGASPAFAARSRQINALVPDLVASLLECAADVAGRDVQSRLQIGLAFTFSAMRDQILFPESSPSPCQGDDAALTRALVQTFLGYLRAST
ncbi:MAG: TetR/AcrR family transcriptional regulator [Pseudomonadales bacterium]